MIPLAEAPSIVSPTGQLIAGIGGGLYLLWQFIKDRRAEKRQVRLEKQLTPTEKMSGGGEPPRLADDVRYIAKRQDQQDEHLAVIDSRIGRIEDGQLDAAKDRRELTLEVRGSISEAKTAAREAREVVTTVTGILGGMTLRLEKLEKIQIGTRATVEDVKKAVEANGT